MSDHIKRLHKIEQVCEEAQISKATFYRLKIPFIHIGEASRVTDEVRNAVMAGEYAVGRANKTAKAIKARMAKRAAAAIAAE